MNEEYKKFMNLLQGSYISSYSFKDNLFTIIFGGDFINYENSAYISWIRLIAKDFSFKEFNNKEANSVLASKIMNLRHNEFRVKSISIKEEFISFSFENNKILSINNLSIWSIDNIISGDFQTKIEYSLSCENKKFSFTKKELSINDRAKKLKDVGASDDIIAYHLKINS